MIIVGCDYHPASNKLHTSIQKPGKCKSSDCRNGRKRKGSTAI